MTCEGAAGRGARVDASGRAPPLEGVVSDRAGRVW